jgi:hypothetical protein
MHLTLSSSQQVTYISLHSNLPKHFHGSLCYNSRFVGGDLILLSVMHFPYVDEIWQCTDQPAGSEASEANNIAN